jgi:hypothetical protein
VGQGLRIEDAEEAVATGTEEPSLRDADGKGAVYLDVHPFL